MIADTCFFFVAITLGTLCSYQDIKCRGFPLWMALALLLVGVGWCVKQEFFPICQLTIGVGLLCCRVAEHLLRRRLIGGGDALLLLAAGAFITVNELPAFLIFCGFGGCGLFLLRAVSICLKKSGFFSKTSETLPSKIKELLHEEEKSYPVNAQVADIPESSIPFVPIIVISQWLTFFLYCY
ncbi:MAG: prepilin peptidase [Holosporales bacterium]|jgi:Flp pilus assembly protein protease CpaA|nr:prepilin peptidase [Holosporales bacterium]